MNIGIYEARTRWSELIKRVSKGEEITITRHGVPVARVVPANGADRASVRKAIEEIREFRKRHKLGGLTIREMIEEGRRY